jgi:glutamyl-Q tRNA(Asp) synthetase
MTVVTRFAPSPTGDLHVGHAFAAHVAWSMARRHGGRFLVRIEDIDQGRCRPHFVRRNLADLDWLGLAPDEPPICQSARMAAYQAALDRLAALGVTYPCFCTRAAIRAEVAGAAAAPHGPAAGRYPGTCRGQDAARASARIAAGEAYALRLDAARALALTGPLAWTDLSRGTRPVEGRDLDDAVIARKEFPTSYHLAVVVDDAEQGVTHVTRGEDLAEATPLHRLLYALLGLPAPVWHHHPLCRDGEGRRLAKRADALSIRTLREQGHSPAEVLALAARLAAGGQRR